MEPYQNDFCVLSGVTQVSDFKAFLWRHPEIHGMTRTEVLMNDIRDKIAAIGRQFINDGRPHHNQASPQTLDCLRLTLQCALQQMVNRRQIQNFGIQDVTQPVHPNNVFEIVIQPNLSVERIVVDFIINP